MGKGSRVPTRDWGAMNNRGLLGKGASVFLKGMALTGRPCSTGCPIARGIGTIQTRAKLKRGHRDGGNGGRMDLGGVGWISSVHMEWNSQWINKNKNNSFMCMVLGIQSRALHMLCRYYSILCPQPNDTWQCNEVFLLKYFSLEFFLWFLIIKKWFLGLENWLSG